MSFRYAIEDLLKKRNAAGLGNLAIGCHGMSGEIVSSTPVPGARGCNEQSVRGYGGYLVAEGMTTAAAIYLASLHNLLPELADAIKTLEAAQKASNCEGPTTTARLQLARAQALLAEAQKRPAFLQVDAGDDDRDLVMKDEEPFWVTIRDLSVWLRPTEKGVSVQVFNRGMETEPPLASVEVEE